MVSENYRRASGIVDGLSFEPLDNVAVAQVHATLAVADAIESLGRKLDRRHQEGRAR